MKFQDRTETGPKLTAVLIVDDGIVDSPANFRAHYNEFPPVDDEDVRTIAEEMNNGI